MLNLASPSCSRDSLYNIGIGMSSIQDPLVQLALAQKTSLSLGCDLVMQRTATDLKIVRQGAENAFTGFW